MDLNSCFKVHFFPIPSLTLHSLGLPALDTTELPPPNEDQQDVPLDTTQQESHNIVNVAGGSSSSNQQQYHSGEGVLRWWIPPTPNPGPGSSIMEKLISALKFVKDFNSDEYPRVNHAQEYDICGTLAVPVFEQGSRNCLGVIEVVMTTQQINYGPELESVCKALEVVDLRSSKHSSIQNVKAFNKSDEAALPEIQEVLRSACEMHKLPLAQIWVPCIQQGKDGCWHSEDSVDTLYISCGKCLLCW